MSFSRNTRTIATRNNLSNEINDKKCVVDAAEHHTKPTTVKELISGPQPAMMHTSLYSPSDNSTLAMHLFFHSVGNRSAAAYLRINAGVWDGPSVSWPTPAPLAPSFVRAWLDSRRANQRNAINLATISQVARLLLLSVGFGGNSIIYALEHLLDELAIVAIYHGSGAPSDNLRIPLFNDWERHDVCDNDFANMFTTMSIIMAGFREVWPMIQFRDVAYVLRNRSSYILSSDPSVVPRPFEMLKSFNGDCNVGMYKHLAFDQAYALENLSADERLFAHYMLCPVTDGMRMVNIDYSYKRGALFVRPRKQRRRHRRNLRNIQSGRVAPPAAVPAPDYEIVMDEIEVVWQDHVAEENYYDDDNFRYHYDSDGEVVDDDTADDVIDSDVDQDISDLLESRLLMD